MDVLTLQRKWIDADFERGSKIASGADSWAAYLWPGEEVLGEVAEDVILSRLLALNGERAG